MRSEVKYDRELRRLVARLTKPRSAKQLAKMLGCSLPAVYERIAALQERGTRIELGTARVGKRGPLSTTFVLSGPVAGERQTA